MIGFTLELFLMLTLVDRYCPLNGCQTALSRKLSVSRVRQSIEMSRARYPTTLVAAATGRLPLGIAAHRCQVDGVLPDEE